MEDIDQNIDDNNIDIDIDDNNIDIDDPLNKMINSVAGFFRKLGSCITECTQSLDDSIQRSIDPNYNNIDGTDNDMNDISNSLLSDTDNIPLTVSLINQNNQNNRNIDVKIRLSKKRSIQKIFVKYSNEQSYVSVPFETKENPSYIQDIIDRWFLIFDGVIYTNNTLFSELEKCYQIGRAHV